MVGASEITYGMYTMCMVKDGDRVLLMNRPDSKGFPGYLAPGGKIEFPESLTEGAIREVYEETGLRVSGLIYKGLDEYVVPLGIWCLTIWPPPLKVNCLTILPKESSFGCQSKK